VADEIAAAASSLSADTQRVLRFAAALGVPADAQRDVTFSGLLTALLFATSVAGESGSPILVVKPQIEITGRFALWRDVEALGVTTEAMLAELRQTHTALQRAADVVDPEPHARSSAMSPSAGQMMASAAIIAGTHAPDGACRPIDVLQAYLFSFPVSHRAQMHRWGFTEETIERIARRFRLTGSPAVPPMDDELVPLAGFDPSASAIIRLAWVLTTKRRDRDQQATDTTELLVAAAETPALLPQHSRPELVALREALRIGDPAGPYHDLRERYSLLPDAESDIRMVDTLRPPQTRRMQAIQASAQSFAQRTGAPFAMPRHLLAALLTEEDGTSRSSVDQSIAYQRIATDALRDALVRIVADRYPRDNAAAWTDRLVGPRRHVVATVQPDTIPADARARDELDLRRYSDAIAALIAASAQAPPLSIAVFGPWGSGKSFFMRMIHEAVGEFATAATRLVANAQATPFFQRIVQIEFNAWHYAESNLWASLVHAILVGLQQALSPERDDNAAFDRLLSELSIRQAAESEARERLAVAETRKAEAAAAYAKARAAATERRAAQQQLAAQDVFAGLRATALEELRPRTTDAEGWAQSIGDAVVKAAEFIGRPELASDVPALKQAAHDATAARAALGTRVGELEELLSEAHASARQGSSVLAWLANARFRAGDRRRLLVRLTATLVCWLLAVALLLLWAREIAGWVSACLAVLAPAVVTAGTIIGWGRRNVAQASRAFSLLQSVRDRIETARSERLSRHELELDAAHRAAIDAEAEATRRQADLEAAEAARQKSEDDLRAASSAEQMKRFIASRLADGDYQRHLGLLYTIRADLERLGHILADVHASRADAETPIQRIVLYVDDLDRCPPARVVEVLESIHLLLAFPLFVVVVGVDIRWVSQALRQRYPEQLSGAAGVASPIDYLEKVFQIPFWLPPMDAKGAERLLAAAIGPSMTRADTEPVIAQARAMAEPGEQTEAARPAVTTGAAEVARQESMPHRVIAPPAMQQVPVEALALTNGERHNLIALAATVGISPRRAKRFANLYRLLKASLSPAERRGFVMENGRDGSFATAMALLAATTGAPIAAARLLAAAGRTGNGEQSAEAVIGSLLDEVAVPPHERDTWRNICEALAQRPYADSDLDELRHWAPRIHRFCFNVAEPTATPEQSVAGD
jgi:hypothetical protein